MKCAAIQMTESLKVIDGKRPVNMHRYPEKYTHTHSDQLCRVISGMTGNVTGIVQ